MEIERRPPVRTVEKFSGLIFDLERHGDSVEALCAWIDCLRRELPLAGASSASLLGDPTVDAAIYQHLSPDHDRVRQETGVRNALRRMGVLGPLSSARQTPAQALTRRRNASSVAQPPRAVLDGHLIARQADRAVDVADRTGPASSRTPYPAAERAAPQVPRGASRHGARPLPQTPSPGLAVALRGLTHEAARFPQLHSASSSSMIRYQTDDEGVVSQPECTLKEALEWSKRPGSLQGEPLDPDRHIRDAAFRALDELLLQEGGGDARLEKDRCRVPGG